MTCFRSQHLGGDKARTTEKAWGGIGSLLTIPNAGSSLPYLGVVGLSRGSPREDRRESNANTCPQRSLVHEAGETCHQAKVAYTETRGKAHCSRQVSRDWRMRILEAGAATRLSGLSEQRKMGQAKSA